MGSVEVGSTISQKVFVYSVFASLWGFKFRFSVYEKRWETKFFGITLFD